MSDLIDRQAAIDVIDKEQKEIDVSDVSAMYAYSKCKTIIKQLPSVLGTEAISRQAAIDALHMHLMYRMGTDSNKKRLDDWINGVPSVQPEPHWIPVTEKLPKEDGSYLVSGKWGSGKESVGECEFSVEDGYFQTAWNFDVLAWMPLPETYKEETE